MLNGERRSSRQPAGREAATGSRSHVFTVTCLSVVLTSSRRVLVKRWWKLRQFRIDGKTEIFKTQHSDRSLSWLNRVNAKSWIDDYLLGVGHVQLKETGLAPLGEAVNMQCLGKLARICHQTCMAESPANLTHQGCRICSRWCG